MWGGDSSGTAEPSCDDGHCRKAKDSHDSVTVNTVVDKDKQEMHKRKHRKSNRDDDTHATESVDTPALDSCLYIQAHEADVIRGTHAASARFLECHDSSIMTSTGDNPSYGLIPWRPHQSFGDADTAATEQSNRPVVWLDR